MEYYLFVTNIYKEKAVHLISNLLRHYFKISDIDFEVDNKKSVLKVKGVNLSPIAIKSTIKDFGYSCKRITPSS